MISIKNVILPNKPLNNFELEEASKKLKIKCFRGVFSSTGRRPASLCHGPVSVVRPSVRASVRPSVR